MFIKEEGKITEVKRRGRGYLQEIWSDVLGKEYFSTEDEILDDRPDTVAGKRDCFLPHEFPIQDHQDKCREIERIWRGGEMETRHNGPYYLTSESIRFIKTQLPDEVIDAFLHDLTKGKSTLHINSITLTAIFEGNEDIHHGLKSQPNVMDYDTIIGAHNEGGGHWVLIQFLEVSF